MSKVLQSLIVVAVFAGCVSKSTYDQVVLEQQQLIEQKDSLVADVLATSQMITEINAEFAQVKSLGMTPTAGGDRPLTGKPEERAIMLGKVREVLARLNTAEAQIDSQKRRISSLGGERTRLMAQLTSFQQTIEQLRTAAQEQEAVIADQRYQILTLTSRIDTMAHTVATMEYQAELTAQQVAFEQRALRDTLTRIDDEASAVYYIVGTKDELIKAGVVVNEGAKFLIFGGRTLQPARDLDPADFTRLDRRRDTVLTVPDHSKSYSIVTRQSPKFLASTVLPDGKVKGDLQIASPEFWEPGRFLILVRN